MHAFVVLYGNALVRQVGLLMSAPVRSKRKFKVRIRCTSFAIKVVSWPNYLNDLDEILFLSTTVQPLMVHIYCCTKSDTNVCRPTGGPKMN